MNFRNEWALACFYGAKKRASVLDRGSPLPLLEGNSANHDLSESARDWRSALVLENVRRGSL
jgi:hypothetical protein